MLNILSFNTFVTQGILIFFYYMGAVVIPVAMYLFKDYLVKHFSLIKAGHDKLYVFYDSFSDNEKKVFWFVSITMFVCMELCWRMVFEAMIGYFDMHDYLFTISQELKNAK